MPIDFTCSSCDKRLRAPLAAAGRKGRCTGCGRSERVPRPVRVEAGGPRKHHYLFAHRVLPELAFLRPGSLLALAQPSGRELLERLWTSAGRDLPRDERLASVGLKARWVQHGPGFGLATIRLPLARRQVEALQLVGVHYVDARGAACFRVFTLEATIDPAQNPGAVLCERVVNAWGELEHRNHGLWLADSETAVARALRELLGYDPRRGRCRGKGVPLAGPALLMRGVA